MIEPYYFEIPIYRCNQDTHIKEMKANEAEFTVEEYKESAPKSYQNLINIFHRAIGYPWKYNEVIGWICLYIMGNQIRGDYYFISARRIGKGIRKKRFNYCGKAFEHYLPKNLSSSEIFQEIVKELERLNKNEKPFRNRHIDLKSFKIIGEFVDWKLLVDKLNSFKYPKNN
jgi:hypothetical protein